ncbi:hypothetical protein [Helicobacter pylori]|uniref:hypothetical protein n=1 Tax=Helicobacter pylori TaxID=210 RepID=UPI000EAD74B1|nr:hypothetical protein [Helicobacter pylori]RKU93920.1 hypothetical protein DDP41_01670 [Helicobacter pylori]RKU94498.1 hypothetical protein DDP39_00540 [Helicobacter pylori]
MKIENAIKIYRFIDNENTQRPFKINIKELTQDTSDNFLKRFFRGFNGVKGGVIPKSSYLL